MQFIDRLQLFPTIFANHQDEVKADTSTWPLAYNTLARLLHPEAGDSEELQAVTKRIREILFRDETTIYYAWMIATFAPWTSIPGRTGKGSKPVPPRAVEVGRDSLRSDNKTLNALRAAALHYKETIATKTALLANQMSGTPAEIRQRIGLQMRSWNKDWKLCVLLAILQENMALRDFAEGKNHHPFMITSQYSRCVVAREYDQFLAYIVEKDLEGVCELKPIVNGDEIMKSLGAKKGPWMSKAVNMALEWQLLHPDSTDKEEVLKEIAGRQAELK